MMQEELQPVRLKDDFYRDGFYKAFIALLGLVSAIVLLAGLSIYILMTKPAPVLFTTDNEWRILPPVPLNEPYLTEPDLLQWVSHVLPIILSYDFVNYPQQLNSNLQYFSSNGWKNFLNQLNMYVNVNMLQNSKSFVTATAAGAPVILRKGLLNGIYGWWIQMPINLNYINMNAAGVVLTIQVLVVRVSTLNNLAGVTIDNFIVSRGANG